MNEVTKPIHQKRGFFHKNTSMQWGEKIMWHTTLISWGKSVWLFLLLHTERLLLVSLLPMHISFVSLVWTILAHFLLSVSVYVSIHWSTPKWKHTLVHTSQIPGHLVKIVYVFLMQHLYMYLIFYEMLHLKTVNTKKNSKSMRSSSSTHHLDESILQHVTEKEMTSKEKCHSASLTLIPP